MSRLEELRQRMKMEGLDAYISLAPENRRYLSGFTGSAGSLLILPEQAFLLTDFRYIEQANQEVADFTVIKIGNDLFVSLAELSSKTRRLGFEGDHVSFKDYTRLKDVFPQTELVSLPNLVTDLRSVKDSMEISLIRQAVRLADEAWACLLTTIEIGQTEEQLALDLEFAMRRSGASGPSFDFIVASGKRSALPHGKPSSKKIEIGDLVTFDFGAIYRGYCSDITRTIIMGEPDNRQKEIYELVLAANRAGIEAVKPGIKGKEVDAIARNLIKEAGFGDFFGHGLGHSVGLGIHEAPNLNLREEKLLEPGMVVTIEPGIYLPDWGGVRIEDMVLVTEYGCEVLTRSPKNLMAIR